MCKIAEIDGKVVRLCDICGKPTGGKELHLNAKVCHLACIMQEQDLANRKGQSEGHDA